MKSDQLLSILEVPFIFSRRPTAVPGDMRPLWRIGLITLFLHISSRGFKSSLTRLHAMNWLSKTRESRDQLFRFIEGERLDGILIVRYEPSFNRAIDLATGEKILERLPGNRFVLTEKGTLFAQAITDDDNCLRSEKDFLHQLAKRFTESRSSAITDGGTQA